MCYNIPLALCAAISAKFTVFWPIFDLQRSPLSRPPFWRSEDAPGKARLQAEEATAREISQAMAEPSPPVLPTTVIPAAVPTAAPSPSPIPTSISSDNAHPPPPPPAPSSPASSSPPSWRSLAHGPGRSWWTALHSPSRSPSPRPPPTCARTWPTSASTTPPL